MGKKRKAGTEAGENQPEEITNYFSGPNSRRKHECCRIKQGPSKELVRINAKNLSDGSDSQPYLHRLLILVYSRTPGKGAQE